MPRSTHTQDKMLSIAEVYARVILAWHQTIGLHRIEQKVLRASQEPRADQLQKYRTAVAQFSDSDLRRRDVQTALAQTQISGIFEWFYGEEIPLELFHSYHEILPPNPPRHLHDAARYILALRKMEPENPPEDQGEKHGKTVRFYGRDELLKEARVYYADYTNEEQSGIGGANFLLSCSLERTDSGFLASGEVTLVTPEFLGFKVDTSESDHFLNQVRAGRIHIEKVEGN
jgi:hypothetical protein